MPDFALTYLELQALKNSFLISVSVASVSCFIAIILAVPLSFFRIRGKKLFLFLLAIPLFIPPYLHAFSWMHLLMLFWDYQIFDGGSGASVLRSFPGVIFVLTISFFPIAFFVVYQASRAVSQDMIDAALQSAKPLKVLLRIVMPSLLTAVLVSFLLTFTVTFITFDVPAFLGKKVFVMQIFSLFSYRNELSRALYLSAIPVFIAAAAWYVIVRFIMIKKSIMSQSSAPGHRNFIKLPAYMAVLVYLTFFSVFIFSAFVPLGVLQFKSLLYEALPFQTVSSFRVIVNTLGLSAISSVCIITVSFIIVRSVYKIQPVRIALLALLIVPSITFGIVFITLFNLPLLQGIYSTPFILVCAYVLRFSPLISELFYLREKRIHPQLFEAIQLVSGSLWNKYKIMLPLYKPAIFLAWLFSFWLVATELPITLLLQPPGFLTIIVRLFIVLHYGAEELMSLMTVTLLLVSVLPLIAVYKLLRAEKTYEW